MNLKFNHLYSKTSRSVFALLVIALVFVGWSHRVRAADVPEGQEVQFQINFNYPDKDSTKYATLTLNNLVIVQYPTETLGTSKVAYEDSSTVYKVTLVPGENTNTSDPVTIKANIENNSSYYLCFPQLRANADVSNPSDTQKKGCTKMETGGLTVINVAQTDTYVASLVTLTNDAPKDANGVATSIRCKSKGGLTWLVCGMANVFSDAIGVGEEMINDLLGLPVASTDAPIYDIWNKTRYVATGFFILAFLIVIFANSLSLGIQAYTIKKMLPRIIMAGVLLQFSFMICAIAIDISNVLGFGLNSLLGGDLRALYSAAQGGGFALSWGSSATGFGLVTLLTRGPEMAAIVFGFSIFAFFGVMASLLTLAARQVVVFLLLIVSPLALVAWILPNTEKAFSLWGRVFVRALVMFPLIAVLFKATDLARVVAPSNTTDNPSAALLQLIILTAPLYLIPFTFKLSGMIISSAQSFVDRHRGKTETAKEAKPATQAKRPELPTSPMHGLNFRGTADLTGQFRGKGMLTVGGLSFRNGGVVVGGSASTPLQTRLQDSKYKQEFESHDFSNQQLHSMALAPEGAQMPDGFQVTKQATVAATQQLIEKGEYGEVSKISEEIKDKYGADSEQATAFKEAVSPYEQEIKQNAPQILVNLEPQTKAGEMTGEKFAMLDVTAKRAYLSKISQFIEWGDAIENNDQQSDVFKQAVDEYIKADKIALKNAKLLDGADQLIEIQRQPDGTDLNGLDALVSFVKKRIDEIKGMFVAVVRDVTQNKNLRSMIDHNVVEELKTIADPRQISPNYQPLSASLSDEDKQSIIDGLNGTSAPPAD